MKIIVGILMLGLFTTACGEEGTGQAGPDGKSTHQPKTESVPSYHRTYVIEADGKSYRCFDTGSYNGGLWCTERVR